MSLWVHLFCVIKSFCKNKRCIYYVCCLTYFRITFWPDFIMKKIVNQFYNSFQIYYAYFRKSKTFFCQYAGLFDIYESFVVDKKEVRTFVQWDEIFSEQTFNSYFHPLWFTGHYLWKSHAMKVEKTNHVKMLVSWKLL